MKESQGRGSWTGRFGFILAAAGSAIGLGNLWKFPYITHVNGGGSFVLIYLFCILLVGIPIMVAEILLGKIGQKNPVGIFKKLSPKSPFILIGYLGVFTGFVILSYYAIISGWTLEYLVKSASSNYFTTQQETIIDYKINNKKNDVIEKSVKNNKNSGKFDSLINNISSNLNGKNKKQFSNFSKDEKWKLIKHIGLISSNEIFGDKNVCLFLTESKSGKPNQEDDKPADSFSKYEGVINYYQNQRWKDFLVSKNLTEKDFLDGLNKKWPEKKDLWKKEYFESLKGQIQNNLYKKYIASEKSLKFRQKLLQHRGYLDMDPGEKNSEPDRKKISLLEKKMES